VIKIDNMGEESFNIDSEFKELRELQDLMTRIESFNNEELNEYDNFKISIETKFTNSSK
jgi:hypothetical protein